MPGLRKRLLRIALFGVGLFLAAGVAVYLALPGLVRRVALAQLARMGLDTADVEVRRISPFGVDVAGVRLDADGGARVDSIRVDCSPASLARLRVSRVAISGGEITIRIRNGKVDLGPLAKFKPPASSGKSSSGPPRLPLDRFDLNACSLVVDWDGRILRAPAQATLVNTSNGAHAKATASFGAATLSADVAQDLAANAWDVVVQSSGLDAGTLAPLLPPLPSPPRFGGEMSLRAKIHAAPSGVIAQAAFACKKAWLSVMAGGYPASVEDIDVEASFEGAPRPTRVGLAVSAASASWRQWKASDLRMEASCAGGKLSVQANGKGDFWKLEALSLAAPDPLSPDAAEGRAEVEWKAEAGLPPEIETLARGFGCDVSALGRAALSGRAAAPLAPLLRRQAPVVEITEARMSLAPANIMAPGGLTIEGFRADAGLTAKVADGQATARVAPGSGVWIGRVATAEGLAVEPGAAGRLAGVEVQGDGLRATAPLAAPKSARMAGVARLVLAPSRVKTGGAEMVSGLSGEARFDLRATAKSLAVLLQPGAWFGFDKVSAGGAVVKPWRLSIETPEAQPVLSAALGGQGAEAAFVLTVAGPPLKARHAAATIDVESVRATLSGKREGGALSGRATTVVSGLAVNAARHEVEAALKSATLETVFAKAEAGQPDVHASLHLDGAKLVSKGSVLFDTGALAPVTAAYTTTSRKGSAKAEWNVQEGAPLRVTADVDLSGRRLAGGMTARIDSYRIETGGRVSEAVFDRSGMDISGVVSLDADVRMRYGRLYPLITVAVQDITAISRQFQARIDGLRGKVTLTQFFPPATPGGQRFEFTSAEAGQLRVSDGLIEFRVEDDPSALFIERVEAGWAGGRLYDHALRIAPGQKEISVRVFADGLGLGQILKLTGSPPESGSGELYGMLPVTVPFNNPADIKFSKGFLYGKPGKGWWSLVGETAGAVRQVLEQALLRDDMESKVQGHFRQLIDGLINYEFETLKVEFLPLDDGLTARIETRGRSRDPKRPVEYSGGIVLNLNHIDRALKGAIIMKKSADAVTGQALESIFGEGARAGKTEQPAKAKTDPETEKALKSLFGE
ncbi:MAG TPA: hypothetical protein P5137_00155 [Candidatus Brocadiia bacterium]|nr:hypothetical protein [Candidatus Brocadiia bacterium]